MAKNLQFSLIAILLIGFCYGKTTTSKPEEIQQEVTVEAGDSVSGISSLHKANDGADGSLKDSGNSNNIQPISKMFLRQFGLNGWG